MDNNEKPSGTVARDAETNPTILGKEDIKEQRRLIKNVVVISLAFMIQFVAYKGAGNLQSSIHASSVGTDTLSTIYGSLIVSNIFLPVVIIRRFGCKSAVAFSFITYMPYMLAQFYPSYFTMIPAAILLGIGAAPLWCGKCTYLSVAAEKYSAMTGIPSDVITVRFFGIFFMLFQLAQIFGNLISSLIFLKAATHILPGMDVRDVCGMNFCPSTVTGNKTNLARPAAERIYMVAGIYLACMACAVVVVLFGVDSLKRYGEGTRVASGSGLTGFKLLAITLKLNAEPKQLLVIPITMFLGFGQAFMAAEYTKAYVGCAWGIQNIGFVMICYGVFNSLSAWSSGWIVKLTGRLTIVCSACVLHSFVLLAVYMWKPHPDEFLVFFLIAALWGICDGVWLVQINALCGIIFPGREEAAYSNFRLWESLGFLFSHGYSARVCVMTKICVVFSFLVVGMVGYVIIELGEIKTKKQKALQVAAT